MAIDPNDPTRFDQLAAMGVSPEHINALRSISLKSTPPPERTPTGAPQRYNFDGDSLGFLSNGGGYDRIPPSSATNPATAQNYWQDLIDRGTPLGDVQKLMLGQNQSNIAGMTSPEEIRAMGSVGIYPPAGTPLPSGAIAGGGSSLSMPSTFSVSGPLTGGLAGQFGFPVGQGTNVMEFFQRLGITPPNFVSDLAAGRPSQPTDLGRATQRLGGLSLPSPQMLGGLNPSGLQFLASIFEALLGIPFQDILSASMQPFQGLQQGRQGRTQYLGFS